MTLYQVLHELQIVLALILGACPLCRQPITPARLAAALTLAIANAPADLKVPATYLLAWVEFDAKRYTPAAELWKQLIDNYPKHALAAAYKPAARDCAPAASFADVPEYPAPTGVP